MERVMTLKIIDQTVVYEGWGRYLLLKVALPDGAIIERQMDDHGVAAAVLPYDVERRTVLMARLPRMGPLFQGLDPYMIEAAAGMIDPGETGEGCVRREALEELGVKLTTLESVANVWTAPGVTTEKVDLYLAPYRQEDRVAKGGGVAGEHEDIEVLEVTLQSLWPQARSGQINDVKTLLLIYALRDRYPELFA